MSAVVLDAIHAYISPRDEVLRFLPHRDRRLVGAWCFLDVYGPSDVSQAAGMTVAPHPHTGLQTVSWVVQGRVLHRDSLGTTALVEPGRAGVMTAGRGIAHSENSPDEHPPVLQGVQLWVALPEASRGAEPAFDLASPAPSGEFGDVTATVFLGSLGRLAASAPTFSPLLGAELTGPEGSRGTGTLPVAASYEHLAVALDGEATVGGQAIGVEKAVYLPPGASELPVELGEGARVLLIGGEPFGEEIVMWWNFVVRSHDEVVAARAEWEARGARFGEVSHYPTDDRYAAPALPHVRLVPRGAVR